MSTLPRATSSNLTIDPAVLEIDPRLLELDGRVYKDRSRPAAAKRALYHFARAHQIRTVSSPGNFFTDFTNFQTSADYTNDGGTQEAGADGYHLHSHGNNSSRLVFNYPLNDGSSPHTVVRTWFRGAPDNGKNSYVILIEPSCANNPVPGNFCDEIDIVEYYGQTSNQRGEFTIHANGQQNNVGFSVWPTAQNGLGNPGTTITSYGIYLEPGNYLSWALFAPDGLQVWTMDQSSSDGGYVPSRSMNLYVGEWDIGASEGSNVDIPPGSFTGDSWCVLQSMQVYTDF